MMMHFKIQCYCWHFLPFVCSCSSAEWLPPALVITTTSVYLPFCWTVTLPGLRFYLELHSCHSSPYGGGLTNASAFELEVRRWPALCFVPSKHLPLSLKTNDINYHPLFLVVTWNLLQKSTNCTHFSDLCQFIFQLYGQSVPEEIGVILLS